MGQNNIDKDAVLINFVLKTVSSKLVIKLIFMEYNQLNKLTFLP